MADVATLGIAVDSGQVEKGAQALDELTNAAKRAEAATTGVTSGTTNAAVAAEKVSGSSTNAAAALSKEAAAGQNAARALQMHSSQAGKSAMNVANLAAQFQDIGVTVAMGMSPLQIALQQGTQLSAILGPMGVGAAVRSLGAAFMSVLSPVSLLTMGLVAAGAAAVQYFFGINQSSPQADASLSQQAGIVDGLVEKWGEAVPALQAYAQARKAAEASEKEAASIKVVTDEQWNAAAAAATQYGSKMRETLETLYQFRAVSREQILAIVDEYDRLVAAIEDHNLNAQHLIDLQASVTSAFASAGADGVGPYQTALSGLIGVLEKVLGLNAALATQQAFEATIKDSTLPTLDPLNFLDEDRDRTNRANATKSQTQLAAAAAAPRASSTPKVDDYANAVKSLQERTAALAAQNAAQASLNPLINDYGFSLTKAKAAADLLVAAEKDKKALTPELTADIDAQATALANATVQQNRLNEATANAKANLELAKSSATGFLSTLRQGLVAGEGFWKSFGSAALSVIDKIASAIETKLVDALFSSNGGGFNFLSFLGLGTAVAGGSVGGGVAGAAAAKAMGAANSNIRAAGGKAGGAPMRIPSTGPGAQGVHITVGIRKNGLNIEPEVVEVARSEAGKVGAQVQGVHDRWRRGAFHDDVEKHLNARRKKG